MNSSYKGTALVSVDATKSVSILAVYSPEQINWEAAVNASDKDIPEDIPVPLWVVLTGTEYQLYGQPELRTEDMSKDAPTRPGIYVWEGSLNDGDPIHNLDPYLEGTFRLATPQEIMVFQATGTHFQEFDPIYAAFCTAKSLDPMVEDWESFKAGYEAMYSYVPTHS